MKQYERIHTDSANYQYFISDDEQCFTVGELLQIMQQLPPDTRVYVGENCDRRDTCYVAEAKAINPDERHPILVLGMVTRDVYNIRNAK